MAKLYFYYAAMNAGKSTNLLQSAYNYEEREMRSLIFTPKLDDRFGEGKITSRIGLERDVERFEGEDDLYVWTAHEHQRERETRSRHWHIYTVSSTVIHIHPTRGTISKILSLPFYYIKILAVWSARRTVYRPPVSSVL